MHHRFFYVYQVQIKIELNMIFNLANFIGHLSRIEFRFCFVAFCPLQIKAEN